MTQFAITNKQSLFKLNRPEIRKLCRWIVTRQDRPGFSCSLVFVDDKQIHEINRKFLDHDYPTDVISFPLQDDLPDPQSTDGEIIVSTEAALRWAQKHKLKATYELYLYVVHGLLHLAGYDDIDLKDRKRMHRRQKQLLEEFFEGFEKY